MTRNKTNEPDFKWKSNIFWLPIRTFHSCLLPNHWSRETKTPTARGIPHNINLSGPDCSKSGYISIHGQQISVDETNCTIHWIVIYPVIALSTL